MLPRLAHLTSDVNHLIASHPRPVHSGVAEMADNDRRGAFALIAGGLLAITTSAFALDQAAAAEAVVRRPAVHGPVARPRPSHTATARPLTIRRRTTVPPIDIVGGPGDFGNDYIVRQHAWNDPRLYKFGPFRTGGDIFYGDQAGNPIARGNADLGQVAGFGSARGGYGGPHFDAVGGFHNGPGPDFKTDKDYASGSLSRPDYGEIDPRYSSVAVRAASLMTGVVPANDRSTGRHLTAEGRSTTASFEQAKADFAAPMRHQAPVESGFANGGLLSIGIDDDAF